MKRRSDRAEDPGSLREQLIGFGERSFRKSHYPELQRRLADLERFRALLDTAHDSIFLVEARSGRLVDVNASASRQTGRTREELLGRTLREVVFPAGDADREVPASLAPGEARTIGAELAGRDARIPVEATVQRATFGGEEYAIVVARDITDRKRAEEALGLSEERLRHSQKMEAIGRLAGGVAHDFNNLLTVITGCCAMMLRKVGPGHPLRREVEQIERSSGRAAELTMQLLAFSRRQVLSPKVLDLNTVVAGMEKMFRRLIGEDIELVSVPGKGLWKVKADAGQIEQVIVNLAVNARDAMPKGGRLTIRTENVVAGDADPSLPPSMSSGPYVLLSVGDTGTGMDRATRERLFEPFFTTKEPGKGTGLGLSTVYGIVRQSGGHISVDTGPGRGTTFRIHLPRTEETAPPEESPQPLPPVAGGHETILLAEDEESVRELVREILEGAGHAVLVARDGEEAVEICRREGKRIRLLVTDVVMPRMSGYELAERAVSLAPEAKVLFMSGYADDTVAGGGKRKPGAAFLQKPFSPGELVLKVREQLDPSR